MMYVCEMHSNRERKKRIKGGEENEGVVEGGRYCTSRLMRRRERREKKKKHLGVYTAAMKGSKKDVEAFMAQIRA